LCTKLADDAKVTVFPRRRSSFDYAFLALLSYGERSIGCD